MMTDRRSSTGEPELIVVTGPPGAGKTTVSRVLSGMFEHSAQVAGDDFFGFIDQGYLAPWTTAAHHQNEIVISAAAAAVGQLAAGGYIVVYDGVIGPWSVDDFARAADLSRLHYAVLLPPQPMCLQRISSRTGHGFTDLDAARHMYTDFAKADLDRRHILTGTDDPATVASHIYRLVQNRSILRSTQFADVDP
jgi:energy-coupling factor transporter ATP-binding protein EcfA2